MLRRYSIQLIIFLALVVVFMPNGTFWEIAAFFILAVGALIALIRGGRWLWPYIWRFRQFNLEIGSALCSDDYHAELPQNEQYHHSQTITIDSPQQITFLLQLKSKQKQVYFGLRYLDRDGKDFPNSVIGLVKADGFQAHQQYWGVNGQSNHEGGVRGNITYPDRRDAEKDCYMRITAKVRQSCIGKLIFEGKYNLEDGRRLSAKADAKLNIRVTSPTSDREDSQTE